MNVLKGIYIAIIQLSVDVAVQVGALGKLPFQEGLYAYIGSEQSSLEKRVSRHLRKEKRKFWHIDYLLCNDAAKVVAVFQKQAEKAEECKVAKEIGEGGGAVDGFGSSDCNCRSHLYRIVDSGFLQELICANLFSSFYPSSSDRPYIRK